MRVLVLGATGFIGGHLCRHLLAQGWSVIAQGRRAQGPPGCLYRRADLLTADPVPLLSDVDAVVHLANFAHAGLPDPALLERLNVQATFRLAHCAVPMGLTFIYLSSAKVLGESGYFDDASPDAPLDAYALSKQAAERALLNLPGLDPIILRPPLVYGPGVGANFARLARLAASPLPLPLAGLTARRSLIHIDDLCSAIVTLLAGPRPGRWLLSGQDAPTVPELLKVLAQAQDRPAQLFALPSHWLGYLARALGREADWQRLSEPFVLRAEALTAASGWRPRITLAEGMKNLLPQ